MPSLKTQLSRALPGNILNALRKPGLEHKSVHEEKLRDYFSSFELPESNVALERPVCIMLFTNRSGSNAIGEYLRASHRFTGFAESFNYRRILKHSEQNKFNGFDAYLQWQVSRLERDKAIIGMKASVDQAMMLYHCGAIPHYFSNIHWLLVQRNDVLSQAISFSIAAQTNQWTAGKKSGNEQATYNFSDIKRRVEKLTDAYAQMNAFCAMLGIEPHRVIYEDFIRDPQRYTRDIAAAMNINEIEFDESRLTMRVQRDDTNRRFKEQFIADYHKQQSRGSQSPL
jgi:trehalose 2-sulfotransferase